MSDTNRPVKAEKVTVSEAKSIPEIAAEYGRTHKIELPTIPGQTGGKPRITAMASEVWMEGYIACEEEKNLIIEELASCLTGLWQPKENPSLLARTHSCLMANRLW